LLVALVLTTFGLAISAALVSSVAARAALARASRSAIVAMHAADSALALARAELLANRDFDQDGLPLGSVRGELGAARFEVLSEKLDRRHYRLTATARCAVARRTIESIVAIETEAPSPFGLGAFGDLWTTLDGCSADAYDSGAGSYADQTTSSDARGSFALDGSPVGSNGDIVVRDGVVRGDATPGAGSNVVVHRGGVTGSTAPRKEAHTLPLVDTSEIYEHGRLLRSAHDYSQWPRTGRVEISGNAVRVRFGATLTIPAGTWYVLSLRVDRGGVVSAAGPVRLYVGRQLVAERGALVNSTQVPERLQIFAFGDETLSPTDRVRLSAKAGLHVAVYAPRMGITVTGGGAVYGALVGRTLTMRDGTAYHFDRELGELPGPIVPRSVKQLTWRRAPTPREHEGL